LRRRRHAGRRGQKYSHNRRVKPGRGQGLDHLQLRWVGIKPAAAAGSIRMVHGFIVTTHFSLTSRNSPRHSPFKRVSPKSRGAAVSRATHARSGTSRSSQKSTKIHRIFNPHSRLADPLFPKTIWAASPPHAPPRQPARNAGLPREEIPVSSLRPVNEVVRNFELRFCRNSD
jgi:hypothetical protein